MTYPEEDNLFEKLINVFNQSEANNRGRLTLLYGSLSGFDNRRFLLDPAPLIFTDEPVFVCELRGKMPLCVCCEVQTERLQFVEKNIGASLC